MSPTESPTTRFGVPAVWVCPSPQRFRAPTTEPTVASRARPTRRARISCGHERRGRVTILNFEFQSRRRRDATNSSVSYLEVCRNVRYSIVLAVTRAEACVRTRSGRLHDEGSDHGNVRPRTGILGGVSRCRSSLQGPRTITISTASGAATDSGRTRRQRQASTSQTAGPPSIRSFRDNIQSVRAVIVYIV
jgi:hypothetical protein